MILFFQDAGQAAQTAGIYVPVWVAVLTLIGIIVTAIGGPLLLHFLNKREKRLELEGKIAEQKRQAEKAQIEGFTFSNESFIQAQNLIKVKNTEIVKYEEQVKELKLDLIAKDDLLKKAIGAQEFVLQSRDTTMEKYDELKEELAEEKEHCKTEIEKLTKNIEQMRNVLHQNNISFEFAD